jgi:hypothetical protein
VGCVAPCPARRGVVSKHKFLYQDDNRIVVDVRKAMLAGAKEVEVSFAEEGNSVKVEVREVRAETRPKGVGKDWGFEASPSSSARAGGKPRVW